MQHCRKHCIPYFCEWIGSKISCAPSITHQPESNPLVVWDQGCCDETAGRCCVDSIDNWWLNPQGNSKICDSYSSCHHRWLAAKKLTRIISESHSGDNCLSKSHCLSQSQQTMPQIWCPMCKRCHVLGGTWAVFPLSILGLSECLAPTNCG